MKKKIIHLENVPSTNSYLRELGISGADEGTVIIADRQTGGKGRLGRSFFSPEGGLYMSVLLRPEESAENALIITAAAAVASARAIEALSGRSCLIKWVNDIYIDGKKVCGILTEGAFLDGCDKLSFAVLGIGINISDPEGGFPDDIKDIAGSISGKYRHQSSFKYMLADKILDEFFALYSALPNASFMDEYRRRSLLLGKEIKYIRNEQEHFCTAVDIDDKGQLIVNENGENLVIGTGEVTVRPLGGNK